MRPGLHSDRGAVDLDHHQRVPPGLARPGLAALHPAHQCQGLQNAILGTLLLLVGVLIIAGTIGVGAGIYLAEFGGAARSSPRHCVSAPRVLAGMPSIVIGYIGYVTLVVAFHWGYSLLAALIVLSVLVLPYIVKTTEVALRQVPTPLARRARSGWACPRTAVLGRVAAAGGVPRHRQRADRGLAISTGELAPLLFTAGFTDNNPTLQLFHQQVPYLTNVTYTDLSLPGARAHATAAAAGLVSLIILMILIILGTAGGPASPAQHGPDVAVSRAACMSFRPADAEVR